MENIVEAGDDVQNHGVAVDLEKKRVRCNYCAKEVPGFNRLKHHLAAVGTDVLPCDAAPADVKACMRNELLQKKKDRLIKEVGELAHPKLPLKRKTVPSNIEPGSGSSGQPNPTLQPAAVDKGKGFVAPKLEENLSDNVAPVSCMTEDARESVQEKVMTEAELYAAKCVGRFFFGNGIDPDEIDNSSFQAMVDAIIACGPGYKVPRCDEVKGWVLKHDKKVIQEYVENIQSSWKQTGCSLVLDSWIDSKGKNLIAFLVDCPRGTVFLRSVDASALGHDVGALESLLSNVIEEIGAKNVIQVIANDASPYMAAARKKIVSKYRHIFWTLCADYCINLILEKIAHSGLARNVLAQAKSVISCISSHAQPLALMRTFTGGSDIVVLSKLKSVGAFLTLQNLMSFRENVIQMFNSPTWDDATWPDREQSTFAAVLVNNPGFWSGVRDVLKLTEPLINVLYMINQREKGAMGFLYEAMDRAKEEIKRNVAGDQDKYLSAWFIIDDVWNNHLHSPLHSTGYYLNPCLFYSSDFYVDAEVTNGLLWCTIKMTKDMDSQDLIARQLDAYKAARGAFAGEIAVDQRTKISPALWWTLFGGQCPQLQQLAVRLLSQTCSSSSRYCLSRKWSEQLHARARNCIEQQKLRDIEFVNNNLKLYHSSANGYLRCMISSDEVNPLDDWFV